MDDDDISSNTEFDCVSPNLSTDSFPNGGHYHYHYHALTTKLIVFHTWQLFCHVTCKNNFFCAYAGEWLKCKLVDTITSTGNIKTGKKKWRKNNQRPYIYLHHRHSSSTLTKHQIRYAAHRIHVFFHRFSFARLCWIIIIIILVFVLDIFYLFYFLFVWSRWRLPISCPSKKFHSQLERLCGWDIRVRVKTQTNVHRKKWNIHTQRVK